MTITQFLQMLRARSKLILGVLAATVLLAVVLSLVMPKSYTASASVVVDVKSPDNVLGALAPNILNPGYMATQADIITSDRVAQRVVSLLGLDKNAAAVEQWRDSTESRGSLEAWLGSLLLRKLEVKPSRESNVISISFRGSDPQFAAAVANAFVQAYIDTNLELKVEPAKHNVTWFDERTRQVREGLEKAQAKLSAFQKQHGITASEERLDMENVRLAELSSQLVAVQAQTAEAASRRNQSGGDASATPEVLQNALVQGLKSELARLESKRSDLASRVGQNHPDLERIDSEINSTRQKIASETQRVVAGLSKSLRANQERENSIKASLDAQRAKVLAVKQQRDELAVLQKDVESAQRAYDLVTQRLAQTSLESQAQQTNISVLTRATEPPDPSSPKLLLNTLVSIFLGTLLGLGAALYVEITQQRIRSTDDVIRLTGLPALGSIPAGQPAPPVARLAINHH